MEKQAMQLGKTIERLRLERGWSRGELAEKLGMHPNHVGRWEKNQMRPRPKVIEKMAELFTVPISELLLTEPVNNSKLSEQDPELAGLVQQIPVLGDEERQALRLFLRSLLTCKSLQDLANGSRKLALPGSSVA